MEEGRRDPCRCGCEIEDDCDSQKVAYDALLPGCLSIIISIAGIYSVILVIACIVLHRLP
jgi:hypothetical protein